MSSLGRFHGRSNMDLVYHLKKSGIIKSDKVLQTMCLVDRAKYVLDPGLAYIDAPQGNGYGVTVSAPHMHAHALELLSDKLCTGCNALDVGSGSGYLTVCMALMVGTNGQAVGIDHIPEIQQLARKNIDKDHPELLQTGRVELIVGDGRLGYPPKAPYDAIHVGAAAQKTPQVLIDQLAPGGRLIVPIGAEPSDQNLYQFDKTLDGQIKQKLLLPVVYVPLTDRERQYPS